MSCDLAHRLQTLFSINGANDVRVTDAGESRMFPGCHLIHFDIAKRDELNEDRFNQEVADTSLQLKSCGFVDPAYYDHYVQDAFLWGKEVRMIHVPGRGLMLHAEDGHVALIDRCGELLHYFLGVFLVKRTLSGDHPAHWITETISAAMKAGDTHRRATKPPAPPSAKDVDDHLLQ